jgi:hypothetical protein
MLVGRAAAWRKPSRRPCMFSVSPGRVTGVEAETELAFAGLHSLLFQAAEQHATTGVQALRVARWGQRHVDKP